MCICVTGKCTYNIYMYMCNFRVQFVFWYMYVHVCVCMGCELITFHLIVRNDGKSINHEGLRMSVTNVKAHYSMGLYHAYHVCVLCHFVQSYRHI